jgi:hypothetical protein
MKRTWIGQNYKVFLFTGAILPPFACYTVLSHVLFSSFSGLFKSDSEVGGLIAMLCILLIFPGGYLGHKLWKTLLRKYGTAEEIEIDEFLSNPRDMPKVKPLKYVRVSTLEYGKLVAKAPFPVERVCSIAIVCLVWGWIVCLPWMFQMFSQEANIVLTAVLTLLGILLCLSVPSETFVIDQKHRNSITYKKRVLWWTKEKAFSVDVLEGVRLKDFTEYRLGGKVEIKHVAVILKFSVDELPDVGVFYTKAREEQKAVAFLRKIQENLSITALTAV